MTAPISHQPSTPFGCTVQWGNPFGGVLPDMLTHCCELPDKHLGGHRCHCGCTATYVMSDG